MITAASCVVERKNIILLLEDIRDEIVIGYVHIWQVKRYIVLYVTGKE